MVKQLSSEITTRYRRAVAQLGRALRSGRRGRGFESRQPDHSPKEPLWPRKDRRRSTPSQSAIIFRKVAMSRPTIERPKAGEQPAAISGHVIEIQPEPILAGGVVDHIWVSVRVSQTSVLVVTLNIFSKRNADAGFDSRIWVGRIRQDVLEDPEPGIVLGESLDYRQIESSNTVFYEALDQSDLETLILSRISPGNFVKAWGYLFGQPFRGLHQVHCRWASCAVKEHLTGRDGAVAIYETGGGFRELLLFKFCGQ